MGKLRSRRAETGSRPGRTNLVRIIGGIHRGRKLKFPSVPGLRPTPDTVRETLFNWLQPVLPGAVCLDLFAGSGALGLEAASRGAGSVTMLDRSPPVAKQIQSNATLLQLTKVRVEQADALAWLEDVAPEPADIVFLDPPFADGLLDASCRLLAQRGWLNPEARIYLEADVDTDLTQPGELWVPLRRKRAGRVCYSLFSNRKSR